MTLGIRGSTVADPSLAPAGQLKIDWVGRHMPILNEIKEEFQRDVPFRGKRITICLHLESQTSYLAQVVKAGGAEVCVCGSNPLSTQDDCAAALVAAGITVYARRGASIDEYKRHLKLALDFQPDAIIDDGADLVTILHSDLKYADRLASIIGGCEETTTGIKRLKSLAREGRLKFPMVAVNDAHCKFLFDNRYGTGQSVWDGINASTNLSVAGKTAVVVGYGWCGKGVAMRAKGLGARVIVTEVDPIKAVEAIMDGHQVMPIVEAAKQGDVFITVSGNKDCITRPAFEIMKDGAVLCNAGHFDVEISKSDLERLSSEVSTVRKGVQEYRLADGRRLYLLAEGRLVNLAAADGHPIEVIDMTFSLQAFALRYVVENGAALAPIVHDMPKDLDCKVAQLRLKTWNVSIDSLSEEQQAYLDSWS
jgi:adenosylhomocysteinase